MIQPCSHKEEASAAVTFTVTTQLSANEKSIKLFPHEVSVTYHKLRMFYS